MKLSMPGPPPESAEDTIRSVQPERARVAEDLAYFRKWLELRAWSDAPPPENIRQGSLLLRRLLLDRELVRAWQGAGFEREPQIVAVDLPATVAAQGPGRPEFALAGSVRYTGVNGEGVPVWKPGESRSRPLVRAYPLSQYLESPSIFLGRATIARREVVKYVAHGHGATPAGSAKGRKQEQEFAGYMARLEAKANAYRSGAMHLELFSIGQALAQTPDVHKLLEALGAGESSVADPSR